MDNRQKICPKEKSMPILGEYDMPNGRSYRIVDTRTPYKLCYPEINSGATHLTVNTGFSNHVEIVFWLIGVYCPL